MFDWIVVNVIHVIPPILFITNQMFPKPALPNLFFTSFIDPYIHSCSHIVLYQSPAKRKIGIIIRQLPNGMQMIWHEHNSLDLKRMFLLGTVKGFTQTYHMPFIDKQPIPSVGNYREEIMPSG